MDNGKKFSSETQKKLAGKAETSSSENSVRPENPNQNHNTKKVSLGPNTKR